MPIQNQFDRFKTFKNSLNFLFIQNLTTLINKNHWFIHIVTSHIHEIALPGFNIINSEIQVIPGGTVPPVSRYFSPVRLKHFKLVPFLPRSKFKSLLKYIFWLETFPIFLMQAYLVFQDHFQPFHESLKTRSYFMHFFRKTIYCSRVMKKHICMLNEESPTWHGFGDVWCIGGQCVAIPCGIIVKINKQTKSEIFC